MPQQGHAEGSASAKVLSGAPQQPAPESGVPDQPDGESVQIDLVHEGREYSQWAVVVDANVDL